MVLDSTALERQKGITISYAINLIDTPGHIDFMAEVARSLRVLDGAVFVLSAVEGVQPQSETVWRQADRHGVPRLVFVNKMDRPGADFWRVIAQLAEKTASQVVPLQVPIGVEESFTGVVDLLTGKALLWQEANRGKTWLEVPVPPELEEIVQHWRRRLLEQVAEYDDHLLEKYFHDQEAITAEEIGVALRKAVIARKLTVALCGSAFKNKGIQSLLDAVVAYLPSPADVPPVRGSNPTTGEEEERFPTAQAPLAALAFKIVSDAYVGRLTFLRLYSGTLLAGSYLLNTRTGRKERISRLLQLNTDQQQTLDRAQAGDIIAVVGVREVRTGDTFSAVEHPIVLEAMSFPAPVIGYAIEARRSGDADKLG